MKKFKLKFISVFLMAAFIGSFYSSAMEDDLKNKNENNKIGNESIIEKINIDKNKNEIKEEKDKNKNEDEKSVITLNLDETILEKIKKREIDPEILFKVFDKLEVGYNKCLNFFEQCKTSENTTFEDIALLIKVINTLLSFNGKIDNIRFPHIEFDIEINKKIENLRDKLYKLLTEVYPKYLKKVKQHNKELQAKDKERNKELKEIWSTFPSDKKLNSDKIKNILTKFKSLAKKFNEDEMSYEMYCTIDANIREFKLKMLNNAYEDFNKKFEEYSKLTESKGKNLKIKALVEEINEYMKKRSYIGYTNSKYAEELKQCDNFNNLQEAISNILNSKEKLQRKNLN